MSVLIRCLVEKDDSSVFGFGVPYLIAGREIIAAWRMMMDNSAMSVADQILVNPDIVEPADKKWSMTPQDLVDQGQEPIRRRSVCDVLARLTRLKCRTSSRWPVS